MYGVVWDGIGWKGMDESSNFSKPDWPKDWVQKVTTKKSLILHYAFKLSNTIDGLNIVYYNPPPPSILYQPVQHLH